MAARSPSGSEKRRKRAEDAGPVAAMAPLGHQPPPRSSVAEAVGWAAQLQARAADLARRGLDPERVRAITGVVKDLGKIKGCAGDSELIVKALALYKGQRIDVHATTPPTRAEAVPCWAFWRLVDLLDEIQGAELIDESVINHRSKSLAAAGAVFPARLLRAAADALDED